ncbi:MAG: trigger factor [Acidimicrobiales bacterium]
MKSTVEPLEGNKVKLLVEVEAAEFEVALDSAFRRIAKEVRIPGFRPGKAPRRVLEARVGSAAARQEALRDALPGYYVEALKDNDVDAIAQPEISITAGEESGPVTFEATVEVRPSIQVEGYGGLAVTVPRMEVTEDDVQRALRRLRSADAALVDVDRPAELGDVLTIDLKATRTTPGDGAEEGESEETLDDVQDYSYEIGDAAGFPPEVDAQLEGASAGDDRTFETIVGEGDLATPITFAITVKKVQRKDLPELTDEWVEESSELTTVADLLVDLRERLEKGRVRTAWAAVKQRTLPELVKLVPDDVVPEPLVAEEVQRQASDLERNLRRQNVELGQYISALGGSEVIIEQLRVQAVPAVKADLALRAVADAEGIEVSEDELDEAVAKLAGELGQSVAELRQVFDRNDGVQAIRSDVRKGKALDWLIEHVEVKDTEGNPVDRDALRAAGLEQDAVTEDQE